MSTSGSFIYVWCIFAIWLQCSAVQPFSQLSQSYYCWVFKAVADAGERAGPGLDAELMPPEQPSGSGWWNRLPGRGGGGGLGSRGGSQGDLQHGEAPLSAAQQARDRLSRYSHFFFAVWGFLMIALAVLVLLFVRSHSNYDHDCITACSAHIWRCSQQ